jgi:hypothetical protein
MVQNLEFTDYLIEISEASMQKLRVNLRCRLVHLVNDTLCTRLDQKSEGFDWKRDGFGIGH